MSRRTIISIFAFVTDVVRLYALYTEGGIYMDTDVELIKPLDGFLHHVGYSGFESETDVPTGIMACEKGGKWAKDNLDYYNGRHFVKPDGKLDTTTNVITITRYMDQFGLRHDNTYQDFPGLFTLYPKTVFCPLNYNNAETCFSADTVAIHHFAGSWLPEDQKIRNKHPSFSSTGIGVCSCRNMSGRSTSGGRINSCHSLYCYW